MKVPIEKGEKIGIIGKNGEGKTTLLRMIAGIESVDSGSIKIEPRKTKIAYFSADLLENITTHDLQEHSTNTFLFSLNKYLYALKIQMSNLAEKLAENTDNLELFADILEKYENSGGYELENNIGRVLDKLHIQEKQLNTLSGGEKSRLIMAAIKLCDADLILLDEPTNHLDFEALNELENLIKTDQKAYLIVSHDQKFLDNVTTKILNIKNTRVQLYIGNYSSYKQQSELEEKQNLKLYLQNQKEIYRLKETTKKIHKQLDKGVVKVVSPNLKLNKKSFINSQGKKIRVARDNDKMATDFFNDRVQSKRHDIEIINRKIDRMEHLSKPKKDWGIKLDLAGSAEADIVLKTNDLVYKYSHKLFKFPDLTVGKKEKVAIIGPNGVGKSTFAKLISGVLQPLTGTIIVPPSVNMEYYSQTHENLDLYKNVLENLLEIDVIKDYETTEIKAARNYLHQFLFEQNMVMQSVNALSQGEKSKLMLAKIIYHKPNFLLLDEPTNHLDIPSKERIEYALKHYDGAILVISHDRYFMESIGVERYVELM